MTYIPKSKHLSKTTTKTNPHIRKNQDAAYKLLRSLSTLLDTPEPVSRNCSISSVNIKRLVPKEVEIE